MANKYTVKPALIIMAVWKGLGYTMLLYLAALQSVSRSYYEAAELDGASGFKSFWHITWPMVRPVTFFIIVTNIIGGSQIFTEMNIMTLQAGLNMLQPPWCSTFGKKPSATSRWAMPLLWRYSSACSYLL